MSHTIGLINWHSRKKEGICHEPAARMILDNFCELATNHAAVQTNFGDGRYKIMHEKEARHIHNNGF